MKKFKLSLKQKQALYGIIFISPWLVGFIYFFVIKSFSTVAFSFSNMVMKDTGGYKLVFDGLANYKEALFTNPNFNRVLANSVKDIVIDVPLIIFFSLLMAMLLNKKFAGRGMVRAIFFLPVIMASPAIIGALSEMLRMMMGGVNTVPDSVANQSTFNAFVLANLVEQIGAPHKIIDYIVLIVDRVYEIVQRSGVQIIIFLAALQSISPTYYEVASIEGATAYETFWKVTLPLVSPLIITNVVYTIVDSYNNSAVIKLAYDTAFTSNKFGLSSAMSIITTFVMGLVLLIITFIISKKVFYQG